MLISVIVPVYNSEITLAQCVDSVLIQTYSKFELILINDGSNDSSGQICENYAKRDKRVKVFHKENGGATSARNFGLDKSIGTYVFFMDSDDYITNNALEVLYINAINNEADIVIANAKRNLVLSGIEWTQQLLEAKTRTEIWGGLYKHELLYNKLYWLPNNIVIGEDFLINLFCAINSNKVVMCSNLIYHYNTNNELSITHNFKRTLDHERIFHDTVDVILSKEDDDRLQFSLFKMRYLSYEGAIRRGLEPYNEPWVQRLRRNRNMYFDKIGVKEKFLLSCRNSTINRLFLSLGLRVKAFLRRCVRNDYSDSANYGENL